MIFRNKILATDSDLSTYLKLTVVSVIWGGTFIAGRILAVEAPPLLSATCRFLIASLTLLSFLLLTGKPLKRVSLQQFWHLAFLGFFGIFAYNLCFFYGLHDTNASRASLIVALNPAVMGIMSYLFFRETLSLVKWVGIIACFIGAAIVIISRSSGTSLTSSGSWIGDALIFGCVISWVIYSVFSRTLSNAIGPLYTVTYSITIGTMMLTLATWWSGQINLFAVHHFSMAGIVSLIYLGAIGSAVAYILYYDSIQKIGATRSGVFIALNPLTAVFLGALLLNETTGLWIYGGGLLIITGIFLCNKKASPRKLASTIRIQHTAAKE